MGAPEKKQAPTTISPEQDAKLRAQFKAWQEKEVASPALTAGLAKNVTYEKWLAGDAGMDALRGLQQDDKATIAAATPDLTDQKLQQARRAQMLSLMAGQGRRSTLLTKATPQSILTGRWR